jgi:hypothetical protein
MGRPLGSKNKQKCCTTLSRCLTTQVEAQDEEHLEREIQNVLAQAWVIVKLINYMANKMPIQLANCTYLISLKKISKLIVILIVNLS